MRGGTRKGAGRKALKKSNKKKNRNVCMADDLYNKIMETKIEGIDNFSQKCQYLIKTIQCQERRCRRNGF